MSSRLRPLLLLIAVLAAPWMQAAPSLLPEARRALFLGDSITYSGQYVAFIDAYFATRFPERNIEFLNLGLPSETVSGLSEEGHAGGQFPRPDLHERLARVLEKTKPDLVIACYGMNDGIYLPFSEERFQKFKDGINWLRERVTKTGAKIILVTPPTFDEVKGGHPGYGHTLDRYADWMLSQRAAGWNVVDLHGPMNRYLAKVRAATPAFSLAGDGVHPGEMGHWFIAQQILLHLGATDVAESGNAEHMLEMHPYGEELLKLVQERQRLLKDAWLTETGHQRPGMKKGLPLAEAQLKAVDLAESMAALAKSERLPLPWKHQDIGAVEVKGFASFDQGIFTVRGTLDTWGTNDGFHFVWQAWRGDGELVARVLTVENTMNHAKAGVMFRESLSSNAKHAEACVTPVDGTQFLVRAVKGGVTTSAKTGMDKGKMPYWVKLVRAGDIFSGYESADGEKWALIGSTNVSMNAEIYAGLVTSSHVKTNLCKATLDNVTLSKR